MTLRIFFCNFCGLNTDRRLERTGIKSRNQKERRNARISLKYEVLRPQSLQGCCKKWHFGTVQVHWTARPDGGIPHRSTHHRPFKSPLAQLLSLDLSFFVRVFSLPFFARHEAKFCGIDHFLELCTADLMGLSPVECFRFSSYPVL